ncbi:MAG: OsmC family protein [Bauldia sp.]|nr:OsmC family protein [Bauldia sp.]
MTTMTVDFSTIGGTEAAVMKAGNHTLIVDRPEGKAGGLGLGFNGGQLLAAAVGGCLCNDIRYVAHDGGVDLTEIRMSVTVDMDGTPLIARRVTIRVSATAADPATDVADLLRHARSISMVSNSIAPSVPIDFIVEA